MYDTTFEQVDPKSDAFWRPVITHDGKRYVGAVFQASSKPSTDLAKRTPQETALANVLVATIQSMQNRRL